MSVIFQSEVEGCPKRPSESVGRGRVGKDYFLTRWETETGGSTSVGRDPREVVVSVE